MIADLANQVADALDKLGADKRAFAEPLPIARDEVAELLEEPPPDTIS